MLKFLVTSLVLYFFYKFMFRPSLKQGKDRRTNHYKEDVEIRRPSKNPREDRGEFIDYEEVEE